MKLKEFSIINLTDSYKFSHFNQYPKDIEIVHSYMVSRGGKYEKMIFFGLRYYLSYLKKVITLKDIKESKKLAEIHGVPFNEVG
ncbi:MAG: nicotinamide phosphoribosyltransferase domain-containing protein [Mollicutes bacterium]|nr:MAG: nicotinamide phosphoribosyltransferase domain-containing protein [Mollicutes bacterium]